VFFLTTIVASLRFIAMRVSGLFYLIKLTLTQIISKI